MPLDHKLLLFFYSILGAIIAPFIGLIADRFFNAEKILGIHLAGAF
jgi:hypothetical protein